MIAISPKLNILNISSLKNKDVRFQSQTSGDVQAPKLSIDLNAHPAALYNRVSFKGTCLEPQNVTKGMEYLKMVSQAAVKKFFIFTHMGPDQDAIASALTQKRLLESIGKEVKVFVMNPLKENLRHLDPNNEITVIKKLKIEGKHDHAPNATELRRMFGMPDSIILTDASDVEQRIDSKFIDAFIDPFKNLEIEKTKKDPSRLGKLAIIDHHKETQSEYLNGTNVIKIIDETIESASQLVMQLFESFGQKLNILDCKRIGSAIVADTSINTNIKTSLFFKDAAIISEHVNMKKLTEEVASLTQEEADLALGLQCKKIFSPNKEAVYFVVDKETQKSPNATMGAVHALDEISKIRGPKYSFYIREMADPNTNELVGHTVSIRCKEGDISLIANFFGGGGHGESAGFKISGQTTESLINKILGKLNLDS